MPAPRAPLPPPTPEQIQTALDHASKLHYAFAVRPPLDSPSRTKWHRRFKRDLAALVYQLAAAQFSELPALAIGCVWELNRSHGEGAPPFDVESIRPAIGDHPALTGPGQMRYRDGGEGPNRLIAEKDLRSVWWDEFREEAAQAAAATTAHGSDVAQDGESEVEKDDAGTEASVPAPTDTRQEASVPAPSDVAEVPPPARQLRPRKSVAAAPGKASQAGSSHHALSEKAAGKRPASAATTRRGAPSQNATGSLTLADIEPEVLPNTFVVHPQPCRRCATKGHSCLINPLFKSTCQRCAKTKSGCSITFDIKSDHILAAYLGFAYHKILSNPTVFAQPTFSPTNYPNPLPSKASIQWFTDQFNAVRGHSEDAEASKAGSEPRPELAAPQPDETPRASRSSQRRATTEPPEEQPLQDADDSGTSVRPHSKRELRSRPGTPDTSTLPGTPASAASPPPRSPSTHSVTSHSAPALSGNGSEGNTAPPAGGSSTKGKAKAKPKTKAKPKPKKSLDLTPSTADIPVRRMSKRGNTVMKDKDASVAKESVTIGSSNPSQSPDRLFDADVARPLAMLEVQETQSDVENWDYKHEDWSSAAHDTDVGKSSVAIDSLSNEADQVPEAGLSLQGPSGVVDRSSGRSRNVPGAHSLEVLKSIDKRLSMGHGEAFGGWVHGTQMVNILFCLLRNRPPRSPYPAHLAQARFHPTSPLRRLRNLPKLHPSPSSPSPYGIPVYEVAQQTRARYDAVSAMAVTVEKHSELLSQQSSTLLKRHETLYRKVETSKSWDDGVLPLLSYAKSIVKDVKSVVDAVANLHSVVAGIASAFDVIPPVPANWVTLLEILETARRLQDLHRFSWAKLDQFEEDFRPLRREAATLRVDCDDVRHRLDSILSEVDDLVAPLLRNMARNFSEAISRLETRIGQLDGTAMDSGASDVPGPRRANMGDLVRCVSGTVEALRKLDDRVSNIVGGTAQQSHDDTPLPTIRDISTTLSALTDRLNALDGSTADVPSIPPLQGPPLQGPRPASIGDVMVSVTHLTERVAALETRGAPTLNPEEIDAHVANYLSRLGLSEDTLRRLATHFFYTAVSGAPVGSISAAPPRAAYPSTPGITGAFQGTWLGSERVGGTHVESYGGPIPSEMGPMSPLTSYSSGYDEHQSGAPELDGDHVAGEDESAGGSDRQEPEEQPSDEESSTQDDD